MDTKNPPSEQWRLRPKPRSWQLHALEAWKQHNRGVISVVTGGGKTVFAFLCMSRFREEFPEARFVIVVPTITLLDQWYVGLQEELGVAEQDIACYSSQEKAKKPATVNLMVINTARRIARNFAEDHPAFLIVDECHRAGSIENARALVGHYRATLGLSATPQREYDEGFAKHIKPALGPVIFEYGYTDAYHDKVIAPFDLINVKIDFLSHEKTEYDTLSKRIAVTLKKMTHEQGLEERLKHLLQKRASVSAKAQMRLPVAAKLAEQHRGARTLIFHERVSLAEALHRILKERNHSACLYHSQMPPMIRRDNLRLFRRGIFDVLISCRALDEGMNVPETSVAIIASSTASQRQRIQRLGRVLRPASGKQKALVYTIYATDLEARRLIAEAEKLEGVTNVTWSSGGRRNRTDGENPCQ